jgi:hypothetical protein
MKAFALVALALVAITAPARAQPDPQSGDAFGKLAESARRVKALDGVVWALTAACDKGDDTAQRQCRRVRDARAAELAGQTLIVDGDADAFTVGKWDRAKKSVALSLRACIRCGGLEVEGRTWPVTGTGPKLEGGKLVTAALYDNARGFSDEASAKDWVATVEHPKVELVVKVPAHPLWQVEGKQGIGLEVVGYRVYKPCDGAIVLSSPASGPAPADKAACPKKDNAPPPDEHLPELLTTDVIREAMKPAVSVSQICFQHFHVVGTARMKLIVSGNGDVLETSQTGDFAGSPTGECLEKAMSSLRFPRTKAARQTVNYPIVLR